MRDLREAETLEARSVRAFVEYVRGEVEEPQLLGAMKGIPRDEVQRFLRAHRRELEAVDPARSVILESLL